MSLEGLEALRSKFRERVAGDIPVVRDWIARSCPHEPTMERLIHNIAGAAGTFGFTDLHAAAAHIDDLYAEAGKPTRADADRLLTELTKVGTV